MEVSKVNTVVEAWMTRVKKHAFEERGTETF